MPDEIIVESWRVATVSSVALTRLKRPSMSPTSALLCSSTSRTIRPLARSCEETACLLSASISPRVCAPPRSRALKTKVAMVLAHPSRAVARGAHTGRRHAGSRRLGAEPRVADEPRKLVRGGRPLLRELARDLPGADQLDERGIHRLHAVRAAGLQRRVDLMGLALANQVADRGGRDEHLAGHDAPAPVGGREELLGDDALERHRELHADLLLLLGRERVDDSVDRLRRILGMERREYEVARLSRGKGGRHGLEVAHLADEDHVGVLTERGLQRVREAVRVRAQLALVDDAVLVPV